MFRYGLLMLLVCMPVVAQEGPASLIESEGVAQVDATPSYADFVLHVGFTGATMAESAEKAAAFEKACRKEIEIRQLGAMEIVFGGIRVGVLQGKRIATQVRLRFSVTSFIGSDEGGKRFGELCDKILDLAGVLQANVEGPKLGVAETQSIEEAAVAHATEKAYPAAKAVAQALKGEVAAVEKVTVISVSWSGASETPDNPPDLERVTCTAKVQVAYAMSGSQP